MPAQSSRHSQTHPMVANVPMVSNVLSMISVLMAFAFIVLIIVP
jgi:hypothetical protein